MNSRLLLQPRADLGAEIRMLAQSASSIKIASAFVTRDGLDAIRTAQKGCSILLLAGLDGCLTDVRAIHKAQTEIGVSFESYAVMSHGVFHPKVYLFERPDGFDCLLGSANLTGAGLSRNTECCVHLSGGSSDPLLYSLRKIFDELKSEHKVAPITEVVELIDSGKISYSPREDPALRRDAEEIKVRILEELRRREDLKAEQERQQQRLGGDQSKKGSPLPAGISQEMGSRMQLEWRGMNQNFRNKGVQTVPTKYNSKIEVIPPFDRGGNDSVEIDLSTPKGSFPKGATLYKGLNNSTVYFQVTIKNHRSRIPEVLEAREAIFQLDLALTNISSSVLTVKAG